MLKRIWNKITFILTYDWYEHHKNEYLADSVDLYDLERRIKEMDRGEAYFMRK